VHGKSSVGNSYSRAHLRDAIDDYRRKTPFETAFYGTTLRHGVKFAPPMRSDSHMSAIAPWVVVEGGELRAMQTSTVRPAYRLLFALNFRP
jgi:hypothetical protein